MRTDRDKALALIEREASDANLEAVIWPFNDGSGYRLMIQPRESMETLASAVVGRNRTGEEVLEVGRRAISEAKEKACT